MSHFHNLLSREHDLLDLIRIRQDRILQWLESCEESSELPFYSSVDIRDAGFKMAVVDTNIFPAGFNNLCEHGLRDAQHFFKDAIERRVSNAKDILIIAEEHTRNTWYLENVRILQKIIQEAGFHATVATFLKIQPSFCESTRFVELVTAEGEPLRVYCLGRVLSEFQSGERSLDLVILNNDLSSGIPDLLRVSTIPIYPSIQAGWHARLKSLHFRHTDILLAQLGEILEIDPWLFSALFRTVRQIDINAEESRCQLQDTASDLFHEISGKYRQHHIKEKPYLVIKSDYGTYGMGVLAIEDPSDITSLNNKKRTKLLSGKGARRNTQYLIQEGIPTIYQHQNVVSEVCMYQIENHLIGGFFRSHRARTARQNLNAKGMNFERMCPHHAEHRNCLFEQGHTGRPLTVFDIYRLLARIAAGAAHREILELEENSQ